MTDIPDWLAAAAADRYRLDRELGQGGMATVCLAERLLAEIKTTGRRDAGEVAHRARAAPGICRCR